MDQAELERRGFSIAELRRMAQRRLPRMVFDFCDGGAEDERTTLRNETGFADWEFLPQPLNGTGERTQTTELFGHRAHPAGDHRPDRAVRHDVAGRASSPRRGRPRGPARSTR